MTDKQEKILVFIIWAIILTSTVLGIHSIFKQEIKVITPIIEVVDTPQIEEIDYSKSNGKG